ncbi:helix-turn-helix domain-containing protein [Streptomyces malaysiensis]|uniref:helix-turn-helix domain-containing protein n=1 Tax=Streptomyces malaysiensis TaxID=92644 RepID=UPI0036A1C16E
MGRYLTTKEAAELLGVEERTVYYYVRDRKPRPPKKGTGFPEPKRFGRTMMHDEKELLAWREGHPARTRPKPPDED